jgi:23S rRNA (uracil1939-C5)-methyltransferase
MTYKKNDLITVTIEDIGQDGAGIGKSSGYTIFIKDALIGDTVAARIMKAKTHYAYAKLEKVVKPSSFRVEPKCSLHQRCGGCQLQALSYEKQLEYKQDKVRNALLRIGAFAPPQLDGALEGIIGMEYPFRYRNKLQIPFGYDKKGEVVCGLYAGHTHDIIATTDCWLGDEQNQEILETLLTFIKEQGITVYDEKGGKGLLRHVLVRKGYYSQELMVCLVINSAEKVIPHQQRLVDSLGQISGMASISLNLNNERTNVIMGKETYCIWGREYITDSLKIPATQQAITFQISPLSFYQVNPRQAEKLYGLALDYAGLTGEETVWDLYCGVGTISLFLAGAAKRVYGVEAVAEAVRDARRNAEINGVENVSFIEGEAGTGLADCPPDVIVLDPPRKGCSPACLQAMLEAQAKRIVYISCDSATLARDLRILCDGGYELKRVRAVDQFGQSVHVEAIALLMRKE